MWSLQKSEFPKCIIILGFHKSGPKCTFGDHLMSADYNFTVPQWIAYNKYFRFKHTVTK